MTRNNWNEEALEALEEYFEASDEQSDARDALAEFDCIQFKGDPAAALEVYFGNKPDVAKPTNGVYNMKWLITECVRYAAAFFTGGVVTHRYV